MTQGARSLAQRLERIQRRIGGSGELIVLSGPMGYPISQALDELGIASTPVDQVIWINRFDRDEESGEPTFCWRRERNTP